LLAERLSSAGWPVLTTSDKSARLSRLADMLTTVWRRRKNYTVAQVDVYSGPSFIWAESVCWLLGRLGKPFILTLHGGNLPAFARRWPSRLRRLLNSATVVTTPSRYLKDLLEPYREDLLLLPNAIDLGSYPFRLRSNPQPKLVWLRALEGTYNPCMAVNSLAELVREFPEIQLTMIGPDKGDGSHQRVKSELKRLNLQGQVNLPGAVPKAKVAEALNYADIFLNTTNYESFGVSVMEAAACGLCIVSTNVGGLGFLWNDGHDAILVQPDDSKAMAAAVGRILSEPGLAERLSRNARANAEQFDWSVILPQWERLLAEVAGSAQSIVRN
jgi:glycosyltransferase involved in cell wall biosynthesis